jgi:citrate synthase
MYLVNVYGDDHMTRDAHDDHPAYLSAGEAADALGVTAATLYAYVSRGMLRSEPIPGSRRRRYPRSDVEQLARRRSVRRDPSRAGEESLAWGEPVVDSALSLIREGRLFYRGRDVVELARRSAPERVAALLWRSDEALADELFAVPWPHLGPAVERLLPQLGGVAPVERCQALLPLAAAVDPAAWDLRPRAVAATGAGILRRTVLLAAGLAEPPPATAAATGDEPPKIAAVLAAGWGLTEPAAVAALASALVLCADHELNVSSFTARCVASAAASPYDAVAAALAALKGSRHGGVGERVAALLAEIGDRRQARRVLGERLRRGESVPGFGHPLYPQGDPRAAELLRLAAAVTPQRRRLDLVRATVAAAEELLAEKPSLDVGLVALAHALDLPPSAPLTLFAVGRTLGWIGQIIEEYDRGQLIRPRARYVGPPPRQGGEGEA